MKTLELTVQTGRRPGLFDITAECAQFVGRPSRRSGDDLDALGRGRTRELSVERGEVPVDVER